MSNFFTARNLNLKTILLVGVLLVAMLAFAAEIINPYAINENASARIAEQKSRLVSVSSATDKAAINYNLGVLLESEGKWSDAAFYYDAASDGLGTTKCNELIARTKAANAYMGVLEGKGETAFSKISNALFCAKELQNSELETDILILEGRMLLHQGKFSKAFASFFEAKENAELVNNELLQIAVSNAIADEQLRINQTDKARTYLQTALLLNKSKANSKVAAHIYNLIAISYYAEGNIKNANVYVLKALEKAKQAKADSEIAKANLTLAKLSASSSDYVKAN